MIVATGLSGQRTGLTATAFCSLSDSPPSVLVCVNKSASAYPVIRETGSFSVNILRDDQATIALCFAGQTGLKGEDRFAGGQWITQTTGAPVMADSLGSLDCQLEREYDHGTHAVFVGLVQSVRSDEESEPLIYFRGGFAGLQVETGSERGA